MIPLSVKAIGMISPLGDAYSSCAAARAGITRPSALAFKVAVDSEVEPIDVTGYFSPNIQGFQGYSRLAYLSFLALEDLYTNEPDLEKQGVHLCIHIPKAVRRAHLDMQVDSMEESGQRLFLRAFSHLVKKILPAITVNQCHVVEEGEAGSAMTIIAAQQLFSAGTAKACVLLSVDSFIDNATTETLILDKRVLTAENPVGFIPSEAAVALYVSNDQSKPTLINIESAASGADEYIVATEYTPYSVNPSEVESSDNRGFSHGKVLKHLLQGVVPSEYVSQSKLMGFHDLNGEAFKAHEFSNALVSLEQDFKPLRDMKWEMPSLSFGHIGTANIGVAVCMAIRGVQRGYYDFTESLICSSSDCGMRSVVLLKSIKN